MSTREGKYGKGRCVPGREVKDDDEGRGDEQRAVHEEVRREEEFLKLGDLADGLLGGAVQGDDDRAELRMEKVSAARQCRARSVSGTYDAEAAPEPAKHAELLFEEEGG